MSKPADQGTSMICPLEKAPTGIDGLDEIPGGGLPRKRITLVKRHPPPVRRFIEDMFRTEKILPDLVLRPKN